MDADEILVRSSQVEQIDTVARRTFELDKQVRGTGSLNVDVLLGARTIVEIAPTLAEQLDCSVTPHDEQLANRRPFRAFRCANGRTRIDQKRTEQFVCFDDVAATVALVRQLSDDSRGA